jgi:diacylglycerol kinase (ATP)
MIFLHYINIILVYRFIECKFCALSGVESTHTQSYNDSRLEVVALYSSFHIAQLQVGLSQPHRVGQASSVQVGVCHAFTFQL